MESERQQGNADAWRAFLRKPLGPAARGKLALLLVAGLVATISCLLAHRYAVGVVLLVVVAAGAALWLRYEIRRHSRSADG